MIGARINNYEILERIAQGGVGDIYLAKHPSIGKKVAVKLLRRPFSEAPGTIQRFFHEARIVTELHHPNLVDVLDFGQTPQGDCYIIMEYLEGKLLSTLIKEEAPLSASMIAHIGLQICSALSVAHHKKVIHRDLKSDNIFLIERDSTENFVKLFDFGIAKLPSSEDSILTLEGTTLGTPAYMSPEQATGRPINGQTDIYALGVLLYYMATRTYPFFDRNPVVVAHMQVSAPLTPPRARFSQVDPTLERVIIRCLEKDQATRYQTMEEVAAELGRVCSLDTAAYFFEKKRSLISQEMPAQPLSVGAEGASPSSEALPAPQAAKRGASWVRVPLVLGALGVGAHLSFGGQALPTSSPSAVAPDREENSELPPPFTPVPLSSTSTPSTSEPTAPSTTQAATPPASAPQPESPTKDKPPKPTKPTSAPTPSQAPAPTSAPPPAPTPTPTPEPEIEKRPPSHSPPGGLPATLDPFGS